MALPSTSKSVFSGNLVILHGTASGERFVIKHVMYLPEPVLKGHPVLRGH